MNHSQIIFSRYSIVFSGAFVSGQRRYMPVFLQSNSGLLSIGVEVVEVSITIILESQIFFLSGMA